MELDMASQDLPLISERGRRPITRLSGIGTHYAR